MFYVRMHYILNEHCCGSLWEQSLVTEVIQQHVEDVKKKMTMDCITRLIKHSSFKRCSNTIEY